MSDAMTRLCGGTDLSTLLTERSFGQHGSRVAQDVAGDVMLEKVVGLLHHDAFKDESELHHDCALARLRMQALVSEKAKIDSEIASLRLKVSGHVDVHTLIAGGIQRHTTGRRLLMATSSMQPPLAKRQRNDTPLEISGGTPSDVVQHDDEEAEQVSELADLDEALGASDAPDLDVAL